MLLATGALAQPLTTQFAKLTTLSTHAAFITTLLCQLLPPVPSSPVFPRPYLVGLLSHGQGYCWPNMAKGITKWAVSDPHAMCPRSQGTPSCQEGLKFALFTWTDLDTTYIVLRVDCCSYFLIILHKFSCWLTGQPSPWYHSPAICQHPSPTLGLELLGFTVHHQSSLIEAAS